MGEGEREREREMRDGEGCTYERVTVTNCGHLPAPQITVDYDKMCRYDRICREVRHILSHATEYAVATEYAGRFGIICRMRQIIPA